MCYCHIDPLMGSRGMPVLHDQSNSFSNVFCGKTSKDVSFISFFSKLRTLPDHNSIVSLLVAGNSLGLCLVKITHNAGLYIICKF